MALKIGDEFEALVKQTFSKEGHTFREGQVVKAIWYGPNWVKVPISWQKALVVETRNFNLTEGKEDKKNG